MVTSLAYQEQKFFGQNAKTIFNNTVCAYLIFALNKLKILEVLYQYRDKKISANQLASITNLDEENVEGILRYAFYFDLVSIENKQYGITDLGIDSWKNAGFFTWLLGGYNSLLINIDKLLQEPDINWKKLVDGKYVALGSQECNQKFMQPIIDELLENIEFQYMADLGCGDAGKLVYYAKKFNDFKGLGIDINSEAVKFAKKNVVDNQVEDQINVVCEDAFSTISTSCYPEVDIVTCFMMFHDLLNIEGLKETIIDKLKATFPNMKYFVLGDTFGIDIDARADKEIFVSGFELTHTLRKIRLFKSDYYEEIFSKNNLTILKKVYLEVPNTYIYLLEV